MMQLRIGFTALVIVGLVFTAGCYRNLSSSEQYKLYKAVERGDLDVLKKAIRSGVNPNLYVDEHRYLIHAAVKAPNLETLKYLIQVGANVDSVDPEDGATPLIVALVINRCDAAKMLLEADADPTIKYRRAGIAGLGELTDLSAKEIFELDSKNQPFRHEDNPVCWAEVAQLLDR